MKTSDKHAPAIFASCIVAAAAFLLAAWDARGATIRFEGVAPPGSSTGTATPYTEAGFTFGASDDQNAIFSRTDPFSNHHGNTTDFFGWCGPCAPQIAITLAAANGATFDLIELDATTLEPDPIIDPVALRIVGHSGTGTRTALLVLNTTWTTFNVAGFTDLEFVEFFADGALDPRNLALDNVSVTPIPEPGALAFAALGFAACSFVRRRKSQR